MAVSLNKRVRDLERFVAPPDDDRCAACGYAPGAQLKLRVSFDGEPLEGPDVCPGCGRPLILRLSFDNPRDGMSA